MSLKNFYYLFDKNIILATPPISSDLTLSKNEEPKFILTQFFLNYLIIKLMGIYRLVWSYYFAKYYFTNNLWMYFKLLLKALSELGDVPISTVS
jgi:hypothetical protein